MTKIDRLTLIGAPASPYTRKILAILRYRHIRHNIIWGEPVPVLDMLGIEKPKPLLLPVCLMPDAKGQLKACCDSTPLIRQLEAMYDSRPVLADNPVIAFLDYLIEDFADEWVTKYMFHYRWHFEQDADNAGSLLPLLYGVNMPEEVHQQFKGNISKRQIERLYVVGSNDTTAPIIDASYRRFLTLLNNHLAHQPYMLGTRPGAGDFSLFGQLTQLIGFDPTPRAIAHECAPRVIGWISVMEDQSGLISEQIEWNLPDSLPDSLRDFLCEIGRTYVPAQLTNAAAVMGGQKNWSCEIDGALWEQPTFSYQAKCLGWLRDEFKHLDVGSRQSVLAILDGTGCEKLVAGIE